MGKIRLVHMRVTGWVQPCLRVAKSEALLLKAAAASVESLFNVQLAGILRLILEAKHDALKPAGLALCSHANELLVDVGVEADAERTSTAILRLARRDKQRVRQKRFGSTVVCMLFSSRTSVVQQTQEISGATFTSRLAIASVLQPFSTIHCSRSGLWGGSTRWLGENREGDIGRVQLRPVSYTHLRAHETLMNL
eukprot:553418-Prymnesium_polylepis.3